MSLRIVISCSNYLFSEGLKKLIEGETDFDVVGIFYANNQFSDVEEILKLNPDIIICDYNINYNLFSAFPKGLFNDNQVKFILIGDRTLCFFSNPQLKDLVMRGAVGILPPGADSDLFRKALAAISEGELLIDRDTLIKILTALRQRDSRISLGKREKEIMLHICHGYKNKEIAQKLKISEQTVKSHCNRLYRKLGVSDRLQLALFSYRIWPEYTSY